MSVRELQKAVKDRDQALQDWEQVFQDRDLALQEKADLLKALDGETGKNTQLTKERDNLKAKAGICRGPIRLLSRLSRKSNLQYPAINFTVLAFKFISKVRMGDADQSFSSLLLRFAE